MANILPRDIAARPKRRSNDLCGFQCTIRRRKAAQDPLLVGGRTQPPRPATANEHEGLLLHALRHQRPTLLEARRGRRPCRCGAAGNKRARKHATTAATRHRAREWPRTPLRAAPAGLLRSWHRRSGSSSCVCGEAFLLVRCLFVREPAFIQPRAVAFEDKRAFDACASELPTMCTNGPPQGGRRSAEKRGSNRHATAVSRSGTSARRPLCVHRGARPLGSALAFRRSTAAFASDCFGSIKVPRFMAAPTDLTPSATRAASSWQTGVVAGRASSRPPGCGVYGSARRNRPRSPSGSTLGRKALTYGERGGCLVAYSGTLSRKKLQFIRLLDDLRVDCKY